MRMTFTKVFAVQTRVRRFATIRDLPKETVGRVRAVLVQVLSNDDKEDDEKEEDDKEDGNKQDGDKQDDDKKDV